MFPDDLLYTEDHEWVKDEGGEYLMGITSHVVDTLGDITYIELPDVGYDAIKGEAIGTVETVEHAQDVFAPVTGHVIEVNEGLADNPDLVNRDPYGDGWFLRIDSIKVAELKKLMDSKRYIEYLKTLEV